MEVLKTLIVWLTLAASACGHGPCTLLHGLMLDFKLDDYMGVWYPLLGWSNAREGNVRDQCSKETISHTKGNITIKEESFTDRSGLQTYSHHAWQDQQNQSKITMWMFHVIKVPFWIVDTDYKNWAVVYSCTEEEGLYMKTMLVMGRGRDVAKMWRDPDIRKDIRRSLRRSNLLRFRDLTNINQTNCTN